MRSRLLKPRTRLFGFEYEFLSDRVMTVDDLHNVQKTLLGMGYVREPDLFRAADHYVTFEPGGQIEFCSAPVEPADMVTVNSILGQAQEVMAEVRNRTGIQYMPVAYMPGRGGAPMLLDKPRYHNLHNLLGETGSRGREMMKGTASIHLHVGLLSIEELPAIWGCVCRLSRSGEFAMGPDRRDIWDNTDPSRCGLLCRGDLNPATDHAEFLEKVVEFGLDALDLASGRPFHELPGKSFPDFLDHLTTLFTDVRINMKGITLELRTLDSGPFQFFLERWQQFLNLVQQGLSA